MSARERKLSMTSGGQASPDAAPPFWAACEFGHEFWAGPDRDTYDDAQADATEHDDDVHDGVSTAVVLNDND